ncbi:hypothetical protein CYMTET_36470, partial [Cymbomonas tetramitiformis]
APLWRGAACQAVVSSYEPVTAVIATPQAAGTELEAVVAITSNKRNVSAYRVSITAAPANGTNDTYGFSFAYEPLLPPEVATYASSAANPMLLLMYNVSFHLVNNAGAGNPFRLYAVDGEPVANFLDGWTEDLPGTGGSATILPIRLVSESEIL